MISVIYLVSPKALALKSSCPDNTDVTERATKNIDKGWVIQ